MVRSRASAGAASARGWSRSPIRAIRRFPSLTATTVFPGVDGGKNPRAIRSAKDGRPADESARGQITNAYIRYEIQKFLSALSMDFQRPSAKAVDAARRGREGRLRRHRPSLKCLDARLATARIEPAKAADHNGAPSRHVDGERRQQFQTLWVLPWPVGLNIVGHE
jgi:hypothetical protein